MIEGRSPISCPFYGVHHPLKSLPESTELVRYLLMFVPNLVGQSLLFYGSSAII